TGVPAELGQRLGPIPTPAMRTAPNHPQTPPKNPPSPPGPPGPPPGPPGPKNSTQWFSWWVKYCTPVPTTPDCKQGELKVGIMPAGPGRGKAALGLIEEWTDIAKLKYPLKAVKDEWHHVVPKYLGGDADGVVVQLNAAYHQLITNAFRELAPYGQAAP